MMARRRTLGRGAGTAPAASARRTRRRSAAAFGLLCVPVLGAGAASMASTLAVGCNGTVDAPQASEGAAAASRSASALTASLDKADWIEKTAKLLRNGDAIGPHDDMPALLAMSKEAIVDSFMEDPRFGDFVLSFNLYYLGRSPEQLKLPAPKGGADYDRIAFDDPQALAAAVAVMNGGDFFELYGENPALFVRFGQVPSFYLSGFSPDGGIDAGPEVPPREEAATAFAHIVQAFRTSKEAGCQRLEDELAFSIPLHGLLRALATSGLPGSFSSGAGPTFDALVNGWLAPIGARVYVPATNSSIEKPGTDCADAASSAEAIITKVQAVQAGVDSMLAQAERANGMPVRSVVEIPRIEAHYPGLAPLARSGPLTFAAFWRRLPNSSTNRNRKRAAYTLQTYFCDNLTPLNLADPSSSGQGPADGGGGGGAVTDAGSSSGHSGDVHGSDPGCRACHYKLDPIGGLFRNYGANGIVFPPGRDFAFDDRVRLTGAQFDSYKSLWKAADGSFNTGYFVQTAKGAQRDPAWKPEFGDDLTGLWRYLPESKQARACLAQRISEYVLGPDQVYDSDWVSELAKDLVPGPTSSVALKQMVKKLVLSNTFSTFNPEPGTCYDFAAGASSTANRPPCAVASIVRKTCTGCHDSTDGPGNLDLTKWMPLPTGEFAFPHLDENGRQRTRADSFSRILARIESSDPHKRMPLEQAMPDTDRVTLFNWLTESEKP